MMHQNEMQGAGALNADTVAVPGSGNRSSDSDRRGTDNFYNEWDGGGAGGAHMQGDRAQRSGTHAGRGPKGYQRSDDRIRDDVHAALADDDMLDASEIEVAVTDREVTLTGTVQSRDDKRRAETLLDSISGISDVHNQIRITKAS